MVRRLTDTVELGSEHEWLSVLYHDCCDAIPEQQARCIWGGSRGHGRGHQD